MISPDMMHKNSLPTVFTDVKPAVGSKTIFGNRVLKDVYFCYKVVHFNMEVSGCNSSLTGYSRKYNFPFFHSAGSDENQMLLLGHKAEFWIDLYS